jgi:hypothetical protein
MATTGQVVSVLTDLGHLKMQVVSLKDGATSGSFTVDRFIRNIKSIIWSNDLNTGKVGLNTTTRVITYNNSPSTDVTWSFMVIGT